MGDKKARPATTKLPRGARPPPEVTRDLFLVWRAPRAARRNPQRFTNPVWAWIARHPELSAYQINAYFGGPSSLEVGPGFCCMRFGQSRTPLADGRVLAIGGEHEDHYDPDFFIYNDVIVEHPSGDREIYGYPQDAFAPTDFHSATLVGDRVYVIGGLSYPERRRPGRTPVHALDVRTFAMAPVETAGDPPGWIYEHVATLAEDGDRIVVHGGMLVEAIDGEQVLMENDDEWALDLGSMRWSRTKRASWEQWEIARTDGRGHHLFSIGMMQWYANNDSTWAKEQLAHVEQQLGRTPDLELYDALYSPPVPHEELPRDEEQVPKVVRRVVGGVVVRYVEESWAIRLVIEGSLPGTTVRAVVDDLREKLETLEGAPCASRRVR